MRSIARVPLMFLLLAAALLTAAHAQDAQGDNPVAGAWQGAIEVPGFPLEVLVVLDDAEGQWTGNIDIPAQGAQGVPLENITVDGTSASFMISGTPGEPTFSGTVEGDEMTGDFTQAGQQFPFTLTRTGDAGDAEAAAGGQEEYSDPAGRFSFPVPAGWTVSEEDGYVTVSGPEGLLRIHVLVTEEEDLHEAISEGWELVGEGLELTQTEALEPPSSGGIERTVVVNYEMGDDQIVYQALSELHEGTAYTMLIEAELSALQRRASQLQIVASGFTISAIEDADLTGAEPLPTAEVIPELEEFTRTAMDAFGIPGAVVAVVEGDEIVYLEGFGVRDATGDDAMTPDTHMMIGSTGKTMTSMLVAILDDEGILDWDTPVTEVMPQFSVASPELTEEITVRNLLCACTGVPRRDYELFFNASELGAEEIVESLETFEFFTEFGEAFQYSNQLVGTAGYAAAAADGAEWGNLFEGYQASLQERVLDPIGLEDTTLSFDEVEARGEYAQPHQQNVETGEYEPIALDHERMLRPIAPAGAHWSTGRDMANYLITVMQEGVTPDGQRVVSRENLLETWQPQVQVSATESYGLGWFVGEYKGLDWLYHSGNTLGFTSEFVFIPEAQVGVLVLANGQGTNNFNSAVAQRLFELIYGQESEVEPALQFLAQQTETALAQLNEQVQDAVDPQAVEPWLGEYRNEALGEVTLFMSGEQLIMDAGEFSAELRPVLDTQGEFDGYITYGPPLMGLPLSLEQGEEGRPYLMLGEGAISYEFQPVAE